MARLVIEWKDNDTAHGSGGTILTIKIDGKATSDGNGRHYPPAAVEEARQVLLRCLEGFRPDNGSDQRLKR